MNETTATLTERGQISVPAAIRRQAKLKPGQLLRWEYVSAHELRVIIPNILQMRPSAAAMIGFARLVDPALPPTTAEMLALLREGENEGAGA